MNIEAKNNIIIAKKVINDILEKEINGFVYISNEIPIYEVISAGHNTNFVVGDKIICSSIGTCINKENKIYMFENSKVIGKINEK